MNSVPKVSVCMITYGHEKYIREAIEGVLMQECNFEVELIVANDCSPDSTDEIVNDIIATHPRGKWIKYFNHQENLGMMPNFIFALKECKGEYIALCEGDDYWTEVTKLTKQINILDADKSLVACYHNSHLVDDNSLIISESYLTNFYKKDYSKVDLMQGAHIITSSVVFRNVIKKYPPQFLLVSNGDTFLFSLLGKFGSGHYIDQVISCYRKHEGGVWSTNTKLKNAENAQYTFYQLEDYYRSVGDLETEKFFENLFHNHIKIIKELRCQNSSSLTCIIHRMGAKSNFLLQRIIRKVK